MSCPCSDIPLDVLKHPMLQWGGVLPLVDHVNQSVTNFTYLLIMAQLLAAMINDYEEYILCYVKNFCVQSAYLSLYPTFIVLFHL